MPKQPAAKIFIWFLLFCGLTEFGFRTFKSPVKYDAPIRNETLLRNWPEYINTSTQNDTQAKLVYLSNSQGVGTEIRDETLIYPYLLRESLSQSHPKVHMQNWSVSGLTSEQIELLALQAIQQNTDVLVLAVSMLNFSSIRNYRFTKDRTDINLLAGKPTLWRGLENAFIADYIGWDDKLSRFFQLFSQTLRAKIHFIDYIAEHTAIRWHKTLFGHRRNQKALKSIQQTAPKNTHNLAKVKPHKLTNKMTTSMWQTSLKNNREPRLDAVYAHLRQNLQKHDIKLVWIWVPAGSNDDNIDAIKGQQAIVDAHCKRVINDGWACEDLSQALPASLFIPSTFSSHLLPQGHKAQAQLILPIIKNALH